jgi:hypothetical protein
MKDLRKTTYYLGLQLEQHHEGILMHQFKYSMKVLQKFNIDKAYPL